MKNKVLHYIPLITIYLLILSVIIGLVIAILLQRVNFALNGLSLGIPIMAAVLLILKIKKSDSDYFGSCVLFPFNQQSLIRLFLVILTISFIVILFSGIKSTLFQLLIVFLYCIILIQIFSNNPPPWVIITENIATLIMFIYSTTLTSSYYFGYTDIIPHDTFATITSTTGHIVPLNISEYFYFPLYHIWIASGSIITGFNSYTTIMLLTGPVYAISVIFIYFLFNRIVKNQQIALLTCLLYSISSTVLFYGTYVITRTMAFLGFLILLYLLYNVDATGKSDRRLIFRSFAILISIYIILVHQVSTPMILLLLFILILCEWIVSQEKYINTSFTILLMSIFIGYWIFYSYSFTSSLIISRLNPDSFSNPSLLINPFQYTPLLAAFIFLENNADKLIFLFFGIIGSVYIIWKEKITYAHVFGLFALLTIVLYIPSPILTLWQTVTLLRFDRFQLLIIPFMVLIMAWGIWVVLKYFTEKNISNKLITIITLLIFIIYCCASVGLIHYNENPAFRVSFDSEEMIGLTFLVQKIPSGSHIFADYFMTRYLQHPSEYDDDQNPATISSSTEYVVIPKKQFLTNGLLFRKGSELSSEGGTYSYFPTSENIRNLDRGLFPKNHIYSSNSLEVYSGVD